MLNTSSEVNRWSQGRQFGKL